MKPSMRISPYAPALAETLQTLIAPGNRVRVSPFIEAAQFQIVFDQRPDPARRWQDAREILQNNAQVITELARTWNRFNDAGSHFNPNIYLEDFLKAYLAYYSTVNICKVQLVLLEMMRQERLSGHITVEDIGVGAGTTALAILDFLMAWANVCDLFGAAFPVQSVQLAGSDANTDCLNFAQKAVQSYADTLAERLKHSSKTGDCSNILEKVEKWARQAQWHECNLNQHSRDIPASSRVVLVASNVLNELDSQGKAHLSDTIRGLPRDSIAIIIEPGHGDHTIELNKWRKALLGKYHGLIPVAPCGQEYDSQSLPCEQCWNLRRESLHRPLLYEQFYNAAIKFSKARKRDEFENYLLSWSYVCLLRSDKKNALPCRIQNKEKDSDCSRGIAKSPGQSEPSGGQKRIRRYVGSFTRNETNSDCSRGIAKSPGQSEPSGGRAYHPDDLQGKNRWNQFIKLCPGHPDVRGLEIQGKPEFQFPFLSYGEQICIENVTAQWRSKEKKIGEYVQNKETRITPIRASISVRDTFLPAYSDSVRQAIDEIAYRLFGFSAMHPFQHRILESVLCGRNILGIAATGGGKSECFILPAMLLPGITLVVSPLKSLMQDQYYQRISKRYGLGHLSSFVNGDISFRERQARLRRLELGYYKLFYFTPEQLEQGHILDALRRANDKIGIRYLAMDEAHCISQWGHDFRPSYLNLVRRLRKWGIHPVRIALTATASPEVRHDLCEELELDPRPLEDGGDVYVYSSNRPELNLIVRVVESSAEKSEAMMDDLKSLLDTNEEKGKSGAAIVFMPYTGGNPEHIHGYWPRKNEKDILYGSLSPGVTHFASHIERTLKKQVSIYHSRMTYDDETKKRSAKIKRSDFSPWKEHPSRGDLTEDSPLEGGAGGCGTTRFPQAPSPGDLRGRNRRTEQDAFISGEREIMVATKGFGMGIDKENIRVILHRTPPPNLEAYIQESGRAGRDGGLADTILYYSPDSPGKAYGDVIIKSDHDIQTAFIGDKYVRQQDVRIMRDFLRIIRGRRSVGSYLYFTNDEAIDFFNRFRHDHTPFQWPGFSPRPNTGKDEYGEHEAILDLGHVYEKKTRYVGRILSVLYRIRPRLPGWKKPLEFLESVQEAGACLIRPTVNCAPGILESNYYFGRLLQDKGLTPALFEAWVRECADADMLGFAEFMGLSLKEANSLFWDIRHAGRDLMDFLCIAAPKYGLATEKRSLAAWRNYAGARKRASLREAEERRRKRGASKRTTDDWFGWRELSVSKGWEILPGPAFERDDDFDTYLDAFMKLHDQRQQNDWDAYLRLLTDYVGVDENGNLRPDGERNCLRSVMLGYLETYEVITGNNCLSCSRCVPDGKFEPDMEKRRAIVAALGGFVKDMLDMLKNSHADTLPRAEIIEKFWRIAETEEHAGRSLFSYIQGWTSRLLADTPGHRASLWLRITAMDQGFIPVRAPEFVSNFRQIIEGAYLQDGGSPPVIPPLRGAQGGVFLGNQGSPPRKTPPCAPLKGGIRVCKHTRQDVDETTLKQIWPVLSTAHERVGDHPELFVMQGSVCQQLLLYPEETKAWDRFFSCPGEGKARVRDVYAAFQDNRDMLTYMTDRLMRNADFKEEAHQAWLMHCLIWKGEILPHLRRCLVTDPPETRMAEECLDLLLEEGEDDILRQLAEHGIPGCSVRMDRVSELSGLLDQLAAESDIARTRKLKASHFSAIFDVFDLENNVDQADMAASLIAYLGQNMRGRDWLAEYHVRALCHGRRFEEMNKVLSEHPRLTGNGNPKSFLGRQLSRLGARIRGLEEKSIGFPKQSLDIGNARSVPFNESDYQRLIQIRTAHWAFFVRISKTGKRNLFGRILGSDEVF